MIPTVWVLERHARLFKVSETGFRNSLSSGSQLTLLHVIYISRRYPDNCMFYSTKNHVYPNMISWLNRKVARCYKNFPLLSEAMGSTTPVPADVEVRRQGALYLPRHKRQLAAFETSKLRILSRVWPHLVFLYLTRAIYKSRKYH